MSRLPRDRTNASGGLHQPGAHVTGLGWHERQAAELRAVARERAADPMPPGPGRYNDATASIAWWQREQRRRWREQHWR